MNLTVYFLDFYFHLSIYFKKMLLYSISGRMKTVYILSRERRSKLNLCFLKIPHHLYALLTKVFI